MKKIIILLLICISGLTVSAQNVVSAMNIGNYIGLYDARTAFDANGNSIVSGRYHSTANFGAGNHTIGPPGGVYVVKYDSLGNHLWFKDFQFISISDIDVDNAGNIYLCTHIRDSVTIDNVIYTTAGDYDMLVIKMDSAGNLVWVKTIGGPNIEKATGISIANNSVYLCGTICSVFTDGAFTVQASSTLVEDIFVGRYDLTTGTCLGMKGYRGCGQDYSYDISASSKAIYITGNLGCEVDFDGDTAKANLYFTIGYTADYYLLKLDSAINTIWVTTVGAEGDDTGIGVSQDSAGNCYVVGRMFKTVSFGNSVSLKNKYADGNGFIAKYDPSGICLWAKNFRNNKRYFPLSISTDPQGNSYVCGAIDTIITLRGNGGTWAKLTPVGNSIDGFVAKWKSDGSLHWANSFGSLADDAAYGINWEKQGQCKLVLNYSGATISVGTFGPFNSPGPARTGQLILTINGPILRYGDNYSVNLSVYPNPVSNGKVTITAPDEVSINAVSVYNVEGRLMYELVNYNEEEVMIDVSSFTSGLYLVSVKTSEGIATSKLIVN